MKDGDEYTYYRAHCNEVALGYATVDFLDYGNIYVIDIRDIRPFPLIMRDMVLTHSITIKGMYRLLTIWCLVVLPLQFGSVFSFQTS